MGNVTSKNIVKLNEHDDDRQMLKRQQMGASCYAGDAAQSHPLVRDKCGRYSERENAGIHSARANACAAVRVPDPHPKHTRGSCSN